MLEEEQTNRKKRVQGKLQEIDKETEIPHSYIWFYRHSSMCKAGINLSALKIAFGLCYSQAGTPTE